jgi:sulfotransferase family protein
MNPYLFIVGCPRSGTTLLSRIVDAHPQIAVLPETHWIPNVARMSIGIGPDRLVTDELSEWLIGHFRFPRMQLEPAEVRALVEPGVTYPEFVAALFDLYGRKRGKPLVGEKTPHYVAEIPTLHALFPDARFVHLIRDGRDVCLSALTWERMAEHFARRFRTWREDPVVTSALWWRSFVTLGRAGAELGPGLYREVRYEALVRRPEEECRRLCSFLEVEYDDTMSRFHESATRSKPGPAGNRTGLPITPGLRDWRTQLAREDTEAFEAAAGDILNELGYERAVPRPGPSARRQVARIASLYTDDMPPRRRVPTEIL